MAFENEIIDSGRLPDVIPFVEHATVAVEIDTAFRENMLFIKVVVRMYEEEV
ncbi:MAG: hypothetical protein ACLFNB_04055 [Candidatus Woesearchaeota archaeon]